MEARLQWGSKRATATHSADRRHDIDGLRGFAALVVVIYHAAPARLAGGFVGVDIFFVISGFVIALNAFSQLDAERFAVLDFYGRRVKRIVPSYLLVLACCLVAGAAILLPGEYEQLGKHIMAGAGFISNLTLWSEANYFDTASDLKPLLHLWSLGVEWQFYIVFPLVVLSLWRWKSALLAALCVVTVASFGWNLWSVGTDPTGAFYSPLTRVWELMAGCLLAWMVFHRSSGQALSGAASHIASLGGAALLVGSVVFIQPDWEFPGTWATLPVAGTVLLIAAGPYAVVNRHLLSNRLALWFGVISFPLYLWHWPLLSFARVIEGEYISREVRFTAVVLSIGLAWLTVQFVEKRIRKEAVPALIGGMVMVALLGWGVVLTNGVPGRGDQQLAGLLSEPQLVVEQYACGDVAPDLAGIELDVGCWLNLADMPPGVVFVGDSHVDHYRTAIWDSFAGEPIAVIGQTECLPFAGPRFQSETCEVKAAAVLNYLTDSQSVHTVVLSGYWSYLMTGRLKAAGLTWRLPAPPTSEDADGFAQAGASFVSALEAAGKRVIFLRDIPEHDFNMASCINARPLQVSFGSEREACYSPAAEVFTRAAPFDDAINMMLAHVPSAEVFDPRSLFCSADECRFTDGRLPYYWNGDHLNRHGAALVIDSLREQTGL